GREKVQLAIGQGTEFVVKFGRQARVEPENERHREPLLTRSGRGYRRELDHFNTLTRPRRRSTGSSGNAGREAVAQPHHAPRQADTREAQSHAATAGAKGAGALRRVGWRWRWPRPTGDRVDWLRWLRRGRGKRHGLWLRPGWRGRQWQRRGGRRRIGGGD